MRVTAQKRFNKHVISKLSENKLYNVLKQLTELVQFNRCEPDSIKVSLPLLYVKHRPLYRGMGTCFPIQKKGAIIGTLDIQYSAGFLLVNHAGDPSH
jgi:hypothetical protein